MSRRQSAASAAGHRAIQATTSRYLHLAWPVVTWLGLWPLGLICHLTWGTSRTGLPWVVILQTLAAVALTWLVGYLAHTRHHRHPLDVGHSLATMGLASLFVISATIAAPWTHPLVDLWGFLGAATAASWVLRGVMERHDKQAHGEGKPSRRAAAAALLAAHDLPVDAEVVEATPDRIDIAFNTAGSEHNLLPEDIAAHTRQLEASMGLPPGAATVQPDSEHAAKGLLRLVRRDLLRNATPWPGPAHPGGSVFDPIPMGPYQDGVIAVKVVADKTGGRHQLSVGMSGAGKSNGARVELCELMTRRHVYIVVVDTVKTIQTFGVLAGGLGKLITDGPTARKFFKQLRAVIAGRTAYLGARGLDAWTPDCGLSFLVIQIEEASELDINGRDAEALAKALRSAGGRLIWSLQRADFSQMSTTLRAQLGMSQTYGCNDDFGDDAIPEEILKAGADPRRWRDEWPGCNYLIGKGIPTNRKATPLRDYEMTPAQIRNHVAEWGPRVEPLDPVTTGLIGPWWAEVPAPVEVVRAASAKALGATDSLSTALEPHQAPPTHSPGADELEDLDDDLPTAEELGVTTEDPAPDVEVNARDSLPPATVDISFGPPSTPMTEEETAAARKLVADRIAEFERTGQMSIRPTDFADWYGGEPRIRSRPWFRKELLRLVAEGRLEFDDDEKAYIIHPDPNLITV